MQHRNVIARRTWSALFLGALLYGCTGNLSGSVHEADVDAGFDASMIEDASSPIDAPAFDAPAMMDASNMDLDQFDLGLPSDSSTSMPDGPSLDLSIGPGTHLYTASFQGADIPGQLTRDEVADDSLMLVEAPWDPTRKALRVLSRVGDNWRDAGYPRSEVTPTSATGVNRLEWNRLYRITGAFSFDADTVFPTTGEYGVGLLIAGFQLHGDDGVSPVFSLQLRNGVLQLDYRPINAGVADDIRVCGPAPRGERIDYEILYRGAADATGYVRVSLNGVVCLEQSGVSNRAANPSPGYMKYGIYDNFNAIDPILVMYYDDISYYGY